MRGAIMRPTMLAVGVAMGVLGLPMLGFTIWLAGHTPSERGQIVESLTDRPLSVPGVVSILVLLVIGLAAGAFIASRSANKLTLPIAELAARAEQLGSGESHFPALNSGIDEVDRTAKALSRSASQLTTALAREREFAADASHQLRTPLTALLMRLEEISMTDDIDVVREEAQIGIAQVERLTRVVEDLLARGRGQGTQSPKVSLDSVIASLQREWQPAFERARRSVRVHGERGVSVQATPVAISQIISTLLENSLAHGRGTVDVQVRRSGPSVVLEVTDQGDGVPLALAPHIFERSVSSSGSGLGLALARDLAEANGGRLELVSARPARFALFLSETAVR